ncbi:MULTISPECIES: hypothetical protein [unclassified Pseudofrankia]|uniref:hypothetical protein n=1 Tax=unclassified Pseudofrankia TaxID=2994372 RepID=UPI000AA20427|nr:MULTISPECIES: hypothetical protein [unclassified Pseudofrankia]MDT3438452.1 hypothetical protein [Pseudofrankia sp. BMG5.37]
MAAARDGARPKQPPRPERRVTGIAATARQWRYPREFRIPPPRWPSALAALSDTLARPAVSPGRDAAPAAAPDVAALEPRDIARVATELWRLRRQLTPAGAPVAPEARRALRRLDAVGDVLAAAGVEVQDHDGAPYDSGQNLMVLAFEQTDGLTDERVVQTLRPSVYLGGRLAQAGEVIVGTPPRPD